MTSNQSSRQSSLRANKLTLTPQYSKDDTCILAGLPSLGRSEEHEEFASLFHSTRNGHRTSVLHVGLELELIRSSLGKLTSQKRGSKIYEVGHSPVSSSFDEEDVESIRPLSPGVHGLLKDLESCLVKIQQYDEPVTPCEAEFYQTHSVVIKSYRDQAPNIYSNSQSGLVDKANAMLECKSNTYHVSTVLPMKSPTTRSSSSEVTVNEAFIAATLAGWLSKLYISNPSFLARKTWKRRFFILTSDVLYRFKSLQANATADEYLDINSNTIACVSDKFSGKKWVIEITNPEKNIAVVYCRPIASL
ncbi:hypothetical protein K7432_015397 [Basidiobolus ranarum]|uniref:PH domain-containing protein n=1 Tax=Basidiobolus ranarum TaxID=34480 RepID=A0ABR2WG58_9FUNG